MGYIVVQNFSQGLDRRGSQVGGAPGSLWEAVNVRINRKGEVERRKKWVSTYSLPSAGTTFGMHATGETLYVFGSTASASVSVPSAVTYQRLQHPDGSTAMASVIYSENFDGSPYVIAEFADGDVYHYYDGALVDDWYAGVARDDMTNNSGIATHMQGLIDASADYIATVSSAVITVTGAANAAFDVATSTSDGGGTNDQSITSAATQTAVADVSAVAARGTLTIVSGSTAVAATGLVTLSAGASGSVDTLTVNGVAIISAAVPFTVSLGDTATALASAINVHTSNPEYTATANSAASSVTITAAVSAGATPNTFVVSAGTTTIAATTSAMSGGEHKGVSSVKVDGVEILSAQVNYTSSNSLLAAAVASQINTFNSSPEYTATVSGGVVTIIAASSAGATPNGFTVAATTQSAVVVSTVNMSGGVTAVTGQPQINTFTIGGTFQAGDKFNIELGDESFGFIGNPTLRGRTALTLKSKLYSTASSLVLFSAIDDATVWNSDNAETPGANFINLASQDEGSQLNYGLGVYQGNLAAFARRAIQIWSVDTDETANTFLQSIKNTGSRSPRSVLSFGNNDVFYLADSGIRSLRARDSSNAAYVSDVGTPIDTVVTEHLASLSAAHIEGAVAALEPDTDRYLLALGTRVYVFNYFPGAKISAWTYDDLTDDVGGRITAFARIGSTLYARSGNTIFTYGGAAGTTYPSASEVVATVTLPFLDGNTPGTPKTLEGFDAAVTGTWTVTILTEPGDTNAFVSVGVLTGPTYPDDRAPVEGSSSHFAPKLVCSAAGAATITNLIVHYKGAVKGEEG